MIEVVNRQRRKKIDAGNYRDFGERALQVINHDNKSATIVFVSDASIKQLNRQFRGKNHATDVLSFPARAEAFELENQTHLGDVIISFERAADQAKQNGLTLQREVEQLILHGLLHLCGYDHETDKGQMNQLELTLRKRLGIDR